MMDALALLRQKGFPIIGRIERSSERPGATGMILDGSGRFYLVPIASDASPSSPPHCDAAVEAGRVTQRQRRRG